MSSKDVSKTVSVYMRRGYNYPFTFRLTVSTKEWLSTYQILKYDF